jgi:hypothetical protein
MKKWVHELNREFSKEEVQMANKHMFFLDACPSPQLTESARLCSDSCFLHHHLKSL